MKRRIFPHGNILVNRVVEGPRAAEVRAEGGSLRRLTLTPKQSCDLEMISVGAFSPLKGFMGRADFESVCTSMRLASGVLWPIPILLSTDAASAPKAGERIALHAPNGVLQAVLTVSEVFPHDKRLEIPNVFRTEDSGHPGVAQVLAEGEVCVAGAVETLAVCVDPSGPEAFVEHRLTPAQTRDAFDQQGWTTVAAFQTRNPIHRAHEYLCKCAQEICDGLLVHPLVGETKEGDIPAGVRMECYKVLLENYFVPERTLLSVMPAAMRYAGPREAILHAIIRQNYGCTHFIVGRDHAGVGTYYGSYDAQRIFDDLNPGDLLITPLKFEHAAYSKRAGGMVSPKTFPNIPGDQVALSGTKVREMLAAGQRPPEEFTRHEVADVLIRWATGTP